MIHAPIQSSVPDTDTYVDPKHCFSVTSLNTEVFPLPLHCGEYSMSEMVIFLNWTLTGVFMFTEPVCGEYVGDGNFPN